MVIKRKWKVLSGTMAASAILLPPTKALAAEGDGPGTTALLAGWEMDAAESDFLQRLMEGLPVNLDFLSLVSAESAASVASVASTDSATSVDSTDSVPSVDTPDTPESFQTPPSVASAASF